MDGGFTIIEKGDTHIHSKKSKVDDGNYTTMLGIRQEEANEIYQEALKKGKTIIGLKGDEEAEKEQESGKLLGKRSANAMYGFNQKAQRKQELEKLRSDFEMYKR